MNVIPALLKDLKHLEILHLDSFGFLLNIPPLEFLSPNLKCFKLSSHPNRSCFLDQVIAQGIQLVSLEFGGFNDPFFDEAQMVKLSKIDFTRFISLLHHIYI